jgi:hypothetical protein
MNFIHKFDDTKEMFHSNVYVIHLEVFFSNCLHYNRNALTPKGLMSVDGFLGSLGRLSQHQEHERSSEILKEGGPM